MKKKIYKSLFSFIFSVDGKWGDWNDYETCPKTCGGSSQKRTRKCDNPAPAHGGNPCPGSDESSRDCGTAPCPSIYPFFFTLRATGEIFIFKRIFHVVLN